MRKYKPAHMRFFQVCRGRNGRIIHLHVGRLPHWFVIGRLDKFPFVIVEHRDNR
jgi:hypothetical protein